MKRLLRAMKLVLLVCVNFLASTLSCLALVFVASRVLGIYMGLSNNGSVNVPIDPLHLPVWREVATVLTWGLAGWAGCLTAAISLGSRWAALVEAPVLALCALVALLVTHANWAVIASVVAVLAGGLHVLVCYRSEAAFENDT